jgi:hypothetical protein
MWTMLQVSMQIWKNSMNFITTTHPTFGIVMSSKHKLDVVAKGGSLQRRPHIP